MKGYCCRNSSPSSNGTIDDICRARLIRANFKSGFSDNVSPRGFTYMNIYLLSRVRLGTPLKYVKGLAFADTLTKKDAEPAAKSSPIHRLKGRAEFGRSLKGQIS